MAAMTTERRMQLIQALLRDELRQELMERLAFLDGQKVTPKLKRQALVATRKAYKSVSDRARSAIREVLQ